MAQVRERMTKGRRRSGVDYARALRFRETWRKCLRDVFAGADIVLMPSSPYPAPLVEDGLHLEDATRHATRFTYGGGLAGIPGLSLPCGHPRRAADRGAHRGGVVERGGLDPGRQGLAAAHRLAPAPSAGGNPAGNRGRARYAGEKRRTGKCLDA